MKKSLLLGLTVFTAISLVGCKSKENAYKKAYEKARQDITVVTPVTTTPVTTETTPTTTPTNEYDNTYNTYNTYNNQNTEANNNYNNYSTANVKRYCVIIGSFESTEGAERRRQEVINDGYGAAKIIPGGLGYRVVATSFSDLQAAKSSRNTLIKKYDGAWILDTQK